jgi:hypothetical protein
VTDTKRWAFYTAAEPKAFEDIAVVRPTAPTTDPRRKIIDKIPDLKFCEPAVVDL